MSDDILKRAKDRQRTAACDTSIWIRLSFLQDLIAEIERLRPPTAEFPQLPGQFEDDGKGGVRPTVLKEVP